MTSPITHLWRRLSSEIWEDVWIERLRRLASRKNSRAINTVYFRDMA
jgi:hypothetical protein